MPSDRFQVRRQKLLQGLKSQGVEALLVTNETNVSYLTGFTGDDSWLFVGPQLTLLISDARFEVQIRQECPGLEASIRSQKTSRLMEAAHVVRRAKPKRLGIEALSTTVADHERLRTELKDQDVSPLSGTVEQLRQIKDAEEIAQLRSAVRQAEKGFEVLRATLRPSSSELEVSHDLEHAMRRFGAKGASFPPIIAVGERAALPHARPTDRRIESADFTLVDWGAEAGSGYKSDLTRMVVTGKISTKLEKLYGVVLNAQLAGIAAIRPGVQCSEVDAAARRVIEAAGHGKLFTHGLGHGIGLDIHEAPRFSAISETSLKAGMVVTVEPGVYLEGWGGIRLEDDVLVTRDGCEVLTSVPKELEQAVLR